MDMEHWWNDTDRGKLKYLGGSVSLPLCVPAIHVRSISACASVFGKVSCTLITRPTDQLVR